MTREITKQERVAMVLYNREYAMGDWGAIEFWRTLQEGRKKTVREIVKQIELAPDEADV